MEQKLYLNLKTSWQGIWEVVRTWILNNKNTQFKPMGDLPQRRPSGSREWKTDIERVKAIQLEDVLRVVYEKNTEGVIWYTELYFKRAKRSIYTRITVKPLGAAEPVEVKSPRIAVMLQKRFGQMNEVKKVKKGTRDSGKGNGIAAGNVATKDDIERVIRHIDDKAAFAQGKVKLKPAFMALCLGVSEKQMRRYLADPVWKKEHGFPGEFTLEEEFKRWAAPFNRSRMLNKGARESNKRRMKGVRGKREEDY